MKCDVLVVGAGLAGSTASRVLAECGRKVLVVEKRSHIGGNSYDYKSECGITVHKYGPHIFHTDNKSVWDFVNRFSGFRYYQHKVLSYVDGMFLPFPINRDTICEMFGLNIGTCDVKTFLENEVRNSSFNSPSLNFRDVVVSQVGEMLYQKFFRNYTVKQWEIEPEMLLPDVAGRIPIRESRDSRYFTDKYQGVPVNGYTAMIQNILGHENISLLLNTDYDSVKADITPNLTIFTGKLDSFFNFEFKELDYRSVNFDVKTYEKNNFQPAAVVNYPNDYDWTRITEFKQMTGENSEKTVIGFEYPKKNGEPCYIVSTKENISKRELYMAKVKDFEKTGHFLFIGRLAEYKYYNMDQVIYATLSKLNKFK
ncbi:MAG: UDP-galactopyranose mutase [Ruminiclostridium sp.]|nr:UDP-galactopyranose mutase [Ruminiclostridium sp.]